jgi:hypothetical protein
MGQTMAEHKHQQQDFRAGQQHLALRQQDSEHRQAALVPQHQQQALVEVQALERQRLDQLTQHQAGEQLQYQHQQS